MGQAMQSRTAIRRLAISSPVSPTSEQWKMGYAAASQNGRRTPPGTMTRAAEVRAWYDGWDNFARFHPGTVAAKLAALHQRQVQAAEQARQYERAHPLKWG